MNAERRTRLRVGATVLIASALFAQAAFAEPLERNPRFEQASRTIDISGIDLTSQAGAQRLYRDIARTAKGICSAKVGKGVTHAKYRYGHARRCFNEAVDGALAQVSERTGVDLERVARADRFDYADLVAWR